MKKFLITFVLTLAVLFAAYSFREPIVDALPIDQSGWSTNEYGRCYLDADGDPLTGWQDIEGARYYFVPGQGNLHTGWLHTEGGWYYLDDRGHMQTGWLQEGGSTFYLSADGTRVTGWQEIDGKAFCFGEDGAAYTGWTEREGVRCYVTGGSPAAGWTDTPEGRVYLTEAGEPHTGWLEEDGQRWYLAADGLAASGWTDTETGRFYLDENGSPCTGLVETEEGTYCFNEDGTPYFGWLELEDGRRFFGEDGALQTGWLEHEGKRYYLKEDGTPAVGKLEIDGENYFFSSTGMNFIMVNPWNELPEGFEVELVQVPGAWVDPVCQDALEQMLADCRDAGYYPQIVSSYRSIADQTVNLQNMIRSYQEDGYSYNQAYAAAVQIVAVPGTSEHHLGLALDIVDSSYPKLNHQQAQMPTQKWLMENSWKYGFIMRYPEGSTEITGIIYEPWHYRYVGIELATELHELGNIPLEVYIDHLTNDGTTCGGKLVPMEDLT